jgi:hypothetical protein
VAVAKMNFHEKKPAARQAFLLNKFYLLAVSCAGISLSIDEGFETDPEQFSQL